MIDMFYDVHMTAKTMCSSLHDGHSVFIIIFS